MSTELSSDTDPDVVIIGGGPCGLAAALTLGRARRTVLLVDAGPRRNAAAQRIHNFVTRDGTSPDEFRRIAGEELAGYPNVSFIPAVAESITGERGAFVIALSTGRVTARRVLLCAGMIDELPAIDGFRALWGRSIFICPYCHGWEVQNRRFGYLAESEERAVSPLFLRGWSSEVTLFTNGAFDPSSDVRAQLEAGRVRVETRPITRLRVVGEALDGVEVQDGAVVPLDVLFAHPAQRRVAVVEHLQLACTVTGHLAVDPMTLQTSTPGIFAAGDLITPVQSALGAASTGMQAAAMMNHELIMERALAGRLP